MKAVIQRVSEASVTVDKQVVGSCNEGYMILFGAVEGDTLADVDILAQKIVNLRIFCDENDKMNKSILDIDGEILAISQFTLAADVKKGNRPSFIKALKPYNIFALLLVFSELFCLTAWDYYYPIPLVITTATFAILCICTMVSAKKGVEKWTI